MSDALASARLARARAAVKVMRDRLVVSARGYGSKVHNNASLNDRAFSAESLQRAAVDWYAAEVALDAALARARRQP
jgi:hypothetical protein